MEISEIINKLNNIPEYNPDTSVDIQHTEYYYSLLDIQKKVFNLIILEENILFQKYNIFMDFKEYQIQKKHRLLEKEKLIHQDTILQFYEKEEKYKFPEKYTLIITKIEHLKKNIYFNEILISKKRNEIREWNNDLLNNMHHQILLSKQKENLRNKSQIIAGRFDDFLNQNQETFILKYKNINLIIELEEYFIQNKINLAYQKQYQNLVQHLYRKFIFSETQNKINHQKNILIEKKNVNSKMLALQLQNLDHQNNFEITNYELIQKNLLDESIKLQQYITELKNSFPDKLKILANKKNEIKDEKLQSESTQYNLFENDVKILSKINHNLRVLSCKIEQIYQGINTNELEIQSRIQESYTHKNSIIKLEKKKESMIPNIIKTYNFYMNFYNCDLKNTQIKINMLQLNIKKIQNKKFEDVSETKLSRQKINILKKLQIKIDNKINVSKSTNRNLEKQIYTSEC